MTFTPSCIWRYTLKDGLAGPDVAALQTNVNAWRETQDDLAPLVEDGVFGGQTERGVRTYQRRRKGLSVDGIAGPQTQRYLALDLLRPQQQAYKLPAGLLRGGCELESAYFVGAVNCSVAGGKDVGWMQHRIKDGSSEAEYKAAFRGPQAFGGTAGELRETHDFFYGLPGAKTHEKAWRLAALNHNWPAAAERFANGTIASWVYTSDGKKYTMSDPAPWIQRLGIQGVETGYEWADYYIGLWTVYVKVWTA